MPETNYDPSPERAAGPPPQRGEIDGGMRTGQGADDEPVMTIGDKHAGDPLPDLDGDGRLTVPEAAELLGDQDVSRVGTPSTTE